MAVNTIGQSAYASGLQQKQQNMNNMFAALKSGDIVSAQKAYASSGLPPMATNNNSPLGRLYQALRHENLGDAQKTALDMQGKNGKSTGTPVKELPDALASKASPAQKNCSRNSTSQHQSSAIQHFGHAGARYQRQHLGLIKPQQTSKTIFRNHEKSVS